MDQIKKNLFWIILGVLVLGGIGLYFYASPDLETARTGLQTKAAELTTTYNKGGKPDGLPTEGHKKAVTDYIKSLEGERAAQMALWKSKQIELRFPDVPDVKANPIEFDNWLNKLRDKLKAKLAAANVKLPENFDHLTFSDSGLDEGSSDVHRHRDYRLRYMAIFDEVVDALASKTGSEEVRTFEADPAKPEPVKATPVGPLALANFTLRLPDEVAKAHEKEYEHVMSLANRVKPANNNPTSKAYEGLLMPVKLTGIEVEFVTHLSALPGVVRRFESSSRYFGIVTRVDFERTSPLYPTNLVDTANAANYAKPEFDPLINSHYGEGPVRAVVSFEIYEYDETKGKLLESNKVPVAAPPAGKSAKKPVKAVPPPPPAEEK